MEESEMIWIASIAIGKGISYEDLKYSDYMNGRENKIDEVWEYVTACEEQGQNWFKEEYSKFKLYF